MTNAHEMRAVLRCVQVEILSEGDSVNELMLLVGGMVEVLRPGSEECEELTIDLDGHSSIRGGSYNRCRHSRGVQMKGPCMGGCVSIFTPCKTGCVDRTGSVKRMA